MALLLVGALCASYLAVCVLTFRIVCPLAKVSKLESIRMGALDDKTSTHFTRSKPLY
jgi:hypothetical protein